MSKSIVKKALEIIDDDDDGNDNNNNNNKRKSKSNLISIKKKAKKDSTIVQDRKQIIQTCKKLKSISKPVVTSDQIEELNNYRFGGPSKRTVVQKKTKDEEIFTKEDFERFAKEYNPRLTKY